MSDKELLELAAKAAGIELEWPQDYGGADHLSPHDTSTRQIWNPLTDDGDALRLAVGLSLPLDFWSAGAGHSNTPENQRVMCGKYWDGAESRYAMLGERYGGDKQAATRRAIVRAAAEIGKANHGDK